jgi:hypothetical protein
VDYNKKNSLVKSIKAAATLVRQLYCLLTDVIVLRTDCLINRAWIGITQTLISVPIRIPNWERLQPRMPAIGGACFHTDS